MIGCREGIPTIDRMREGIPNNDRMREGYQQRSDAGRDNPQRSDAGRDNPQRSGRRGYPTTIGCRKRHIPQRSDAGRDTFLNDRIDGGIPTMGGNLVYPPWEENLVYTTLVCTRYTHPVYMPPSILPGTPCTTGTTLPPPGTVQRSMGPQRCCEGGSGLRKSGN